MGLTHGFLTTSPLRGTPLTRGYRFAQPPVIIAAALSRASHGLTTSWLRRTPPKNYFVIFKRRVAALIGSIVPPIHCVAGGELGLARDFFVLLSKNLNFQFSILYIIFVVYF